MLPLDVEVPRLMTSLTLFGMVIMLPSEKNISSLLVSEELFQSMHAFVLYLPDSLNGNVCM